MRSTKWEKEVQVLAKGDLGSLAHLRNPLCLRKMLHVFKVQVIAIQRAILPKVVLHLALKAHQPRMSKKVANSHDLGVNVLPGEGAGRPQGIALPPLLLHSAQNSC
jgi:hypothetical protein